MHLNIWALGMQGANGATDLSLSLLVIKFRKEAVIHIKTIWALKVCGASSATDLSLIMTYLFREGAMMYILNMGTCEMY